jgi:large subunit ribosomal protein L21
MNRKSFWFGYVLAVGVVLWLVGRQRQEEVEKAMRRLREARTEMADRHYIERVQEAARTARQQAADAVEEGIERVGATVKKANEAVEDKVTTEVVDKRAEGESAKATDDLKKITGIGPAFERRFNEAGITRFAQLAALSEDEARQRIGLQPFQGDVASWIEQAQSLASGS